MAKYIAVIVMLLLSTVAVSAAVALPIVQHLSAPVAVGAENGYMYTLKGNSKNNFIISTLADQRLVRIQLVLELDKAFAPKDLKNPDRQLLLLQDALLRTIGSCRSEELSAQNQVSFKKKIADIATQQLGSQSVRSVYVTELTLL